MKNSINALMALLLVVGMFLSIPACAAGQKGSSSSSYYAPRESQTFGYYEQNDRFPRSYAPRNDLQTTTRQYEQSDRLAGNNCPPVETKRTPSAFGGAVFPGAGVP